MVRDGHTGCSRVGGFLEKVEREIFNTGFDLECRDSFSVRGRSQGRGSEIEDRITSEYWKHLPC